MKQTIIHDQAFLAEPSTPASPLDGQVVTNLLDTLRANAGKAAGLAANMIGVHKRIIVAQVGPLSLALINPVITKHSGPYAAEEGCLSLPGTRDTTRYKTITVTYLDEQFQPQTQTFNDWAAQIIQHEVDHCNGILI